VPRKGSMPHFSISIVKLTEGWAWFRVFRKSVAVVMLGIIVRVSSTYQDDNKAACFLALAFLPTKT